MRQIGLVVFGWLALVGAPWGCDRAGSPPPPPKPAGTQPSSSAGDVSGGLRPVPRDGVWGFIDAAGRDVIPPRFERAQPFREGLAAVRQAGCWGFIRPDGGFAIDPVYDAVGDGGFFDGRAAVMRDGHWGAIRPDGTVAIPLEHAEPVRYSDGLARVRRGDLYGFVDRNGAVTIPASYTYAMPFSEGLAAVQIGGQWVGRRLHGGQWGYIDSVGRLAIATRFAQAGPFREGLAWVHPVGPSGQPLPGRFIDRQGETRIEPDGWGQARGFCEGLSAVQEEGSDLWGYIDAGGSTVISPQFVQAGDFHEGRAAVLTYPEDRPDVRMWGYIDRAGQVVIPPAFEYAGPFREGLAEVRVDGRLAYIDSAGAWVWQPPE